MPFNPKIALEVVFLHLTQGSLFPRAERPEELIWNSGTQEKHGKQKVLAVIQPSWQSGRASREKLTPFDSLHLLAWPLLRIRCSMSSIFLLLLPFSPFTTLVYKISLFP